jgi:hypothetical protein
MVEDWSVRDKLFFKAKKSEAFRINYRCLDKSMFKWRTPASPPSDSDSGDGFLIHDGLSACTGMSFEQQEPIIHRQTWLQRNVKGLLDHDDDRY